MLLTLLIITKVKHILSYLEAALPVGQDGKGLADTSTRSVVTGLILVNLGLNSPEAMED